MGGGGGDDGGDSDDDGGNDDDGSGGFQYSELIGHQCSVNIIPEKRYGDHSPSGWDNSDTIKVDKMAWT